MTWWTRHRLLAVVVLAALCAALGAAVLAVARQRDGAPAAETPAEARTLAASACRRVADARRAVVADAPADHVFDILEAAGDAARRAVRLDPAWVQLNGGVYAFEQGLRSDDAGAVRLAFSILDEECARAGAPLRGPLG